MPGQHGDAFARHQFLGHAYRLTRIGAVVARDQLQLLAEYAAFAVDLIERKLHAVLIRVEEGGHRFIAVELADLDGLLRYRRRRDGEAAGKCKMREQPRIH